MASAPVNTMGLTLGVPPLACRQVRLVVFVVITLVISNDDSPQNVYLSAQEGANSMLSLLLLFLAAYNHLFTNKTIRHSSLLRPLCCP